MMTMSRVAVILSWLLVASGAGAAQADSLARISEPFFAAEFKAFPTLATEMGDHHYDRRVESVDRSAHERHLARLRATLTHVKALDDRHMTPRQRDDRDIFVGWLNGQVLEETKIQTWRHNPNHYVKLSLNTVDWLIVRSFAPIEERLNCVIAREGHLPRLLRDAKANLTDMPTVRAQLSGLRQFIVDHHIATIPSAQMPIVEETPTFHRAEVFGELDWPGPLETKAIESFYYVTPPDPSSSPEEQEKFLQLWNRSTLQDLSVHEALPGHFLQGLYRSKHQGWSKIREIIHVFMAEEGWAHYSEQMMLDEGLSADQPKARLAQLQMALLRDCRLIASVKMHVFGMSLPEATEMMRNSCAVTEAQAYKEARRGTADPGYFCYSLGKLEIIKLREDVQKAEGADFSLQHFHDRFLEAGLVPISIIRREILGRDGPEL